MASGRNLFDPHGHSHTMSYTPWKGLNRRNIELRKLRWNCETRNDWFPSLGISSSKGPPFSRSNRLSGMNSPVKAPCPNSTASTPKVQSSPYQRWPCGQCPGYPGWMPTAKGPYFCFARVLDKLLQCTLAPQMAATPCPPWWNWRPWGGKWVLDKSCKKRRWIVFRIHLFGYLFVFSSCIVFTIDKLKMFAPPHWTSCIGHVFWPFRGLPRKSWQCQPKKYKSRSSIK